MAVRLNTMEAPIASPGSLRLTRDGWVAVELDELDEETTTQLLSFRARHIIGVHPSDQAAFDAWHDAVTATPNMRAPAASTSTAAPDRLQSPTPEQPKDEKPRRAK